MARAPGSLAPRTLDGHCLYLLYTSLTGSTRGRASGCRPGLDPPSVRTRGGTRTASCVWRWTGAATNDQGTTNARWALPVPPVHLLDWFDSGTRQWLSAGSGPAVSANPRWDANGGSR